MIDYNKMIDFLGEYGKLYIKGNNISMRCMLCGDSKKSKLKKRFNATYNNGQAFYNCFNCEKSGTLVELYAELKGVNIIDAIRILDTPDFNHVKDKLTKSVPIIKPTTDRTELDYILDDCLSIISSSNSYIEKQYLKLLYDFIENRKIPPEYLVFIAIKGEYKGRIIIPIFEDEHIVYFQGRATDKNTFLKFKNPEIEKTSIIMNKNMFKKDKYIIVTEGIIDAMMIPYNQGTCVLGGSVSDDFLSQLYKYTNVGIIIAVDNDERGGKEREKLISKSVYGNMLYYYVPGKRCKDINELKIKHTQLCTNMYDYIVDNKESAFEYKIRSKMK